MSELTDLEICKRIAEIEGEAFVDTGYSVVSLNISRTKYNNLNDCAKSTYNAINVYSPIKDDAVNVKLRDKYCVQIRYDGECVIFDETACFEIASVEFNDHKEINKSVCLAIIEASNNKVVNRNKG